MDVQFMLLPVLAVLPHRFVLRWLDEVFQGQYPPSFRINYATINKDLENLPPQLY